MALAHELGMHLHQLLGWPGPMTHRQFLAWLAWRREEMNHPSRSDHYQMQTALHVIRANAKNPGKVQLDHLRLKFRSARKGSRITPEESKARWLGHVAPGGGLRVEEG